MLIHIQGQNEDFDLHLSSEQTIDDLKKTIAKSKGYELQDIKLIHNGEYLFVNDLLADQGIKDGSTIKLQVAKENYAPNSFDDTRSYQPSAPSSGILGMGNTAMAEAEIGGLPMGGAGMGGLPMGGLMGGPGMGPGNLGRNEGEAELSPKPELRQPRIDSETARKIEKLVKMGYQRDQATVAIHMAKGVIQVAASFLPLSEEEMKANQSSVSNSMGERRNRRGPEPNFPEMPDTPEDEKLRAKMLDLIFDSSKREALELILKAAFPVLDPQLISKKLNNIVDDVLLHKKIKRQLQPDQKVIVKQLRNKGLTDIITIPILKQVGWNAEKAESIIMSQIAPGNTRRQRTGGIQPEGNMFATNANLYLGSLNNSGNPSN